MNESEFSFYGECAKFYGECAKCGRLEHVIEKAPFNKAIEDYLSLPIAGKTHKTKLYWARCPWCTEDNLHVNPLKKSVYCTVCHKGGDLLIAICESEDISPVEAAESLKKRYEINMELCSNECRGASRTG